MTNRYRIVRRAYSNYTDFASFTGSYIDAIRFAMEIERKNDDGEYLVRRLGQPNWESSSSSQSGFDWL